MPDQELAGLACQAIGALVKRKFHLLAADFTSAPRPFADTLPDRGFVCQPNSIKGNKPIKFAPEWKRKKKYTNLVGIALIGQSHIATRSDDSFMVRHRTPAQGKRLPTQAGHHHRYCLCQGLLRRHHNREA
jgi:hypothetical protein